MDSIIIFSQFHFLVQHNNKAIWLKISFKYINQKCDTIFSAFFRFWTQYHDTMRSFYSSLLFYKCVRKPLKFNSTIYTKLLYDCFVRWLWLSIDTKIQWIEIETHSTLSLKSKWFNGSMQKSRLSSIGLHTRLHSKTEYEWIYVYACAHLVHC